MESYSRHLVAFIDLLGFKFALTEHSRTAAILAVLKELAAISGNSFAQSREMETGHQATFRPATSSFSDNILISYPLDLLAAHRVDVVTALIMLQKLVGYIAWNAFRSKLLVRGGVAIGDLYHEGGVAFGPALVEAYETERSLAIYPRVALGRSVAQSNEFKNFQHNFWVHDDGVYVLGYFLDFVTRTSPGSGRFNPKIKAWISEVRQTIDIEIAKLQSTGNLNALAKWTWFKNHFESNLEKLHADLLEMDGP